MMSSFLTFKSFLPPQALRQFRAVSLDGVEEVVDGDDVVAVLHELQHRVGADEAPGAGHEDGLALAHIDANFLRRCVRSDKSGEINILLPAMRWQNECVIDYVSTGVYRAYSKTGFLARHLNV